MDVASISVFLRRKWQVGFWWDPTFLDLPLGRSSRSAYIPAGARLLGVFLFRLAVGRIPVASQSRLTFDTAQGPAKSFEKIL